VIVWVDVAPSESVATRVNEPGANAPFTSVPKKSPPIADTPALKFAKLIESENVLVDNEGFAAVPAPKKPSAAVAV
jgi:hypothetical protein